MRPCGWVCFVGIVGSPPLAGAGGLFLPGAGAASTSRAGAAVASADDGEAIVLNPAGIAKSSGHAITISAAMIQYAMEFQRRGTYDAVAMESYPYAGQPYARQRNDARPPFGIGAMQPLPVISFITDLGGRAGGLHLGAGIYVPSSYPFRDLCTELAGGCQKYQFGGDPTTPPPAARYDIMKQEAVVILPSLVAAYRVLPELDVGVRLSAGQASLSSTTAVWGTLGPNYAEDIQKDGVFTVDAKDRFVPAYGLGATYRPTPRFELAASYSSALDIHARGTATTQLGASAGVSGLKVTVGPVADADAACAPGGVDSALKACVDLALPRTAQLAGRYKFLRADGRLRADVELDLAWENWGKRCDDTELLDGRCASPGDYRVVVDGTTRITGVDGTPTPVLPLETSVVRHGLRDTYGVRVGGSYHVALGEGTAPDELIVRGGVGYDTAAARPGWLRADLDGAARTTLAVGGAYRTSRFEISAGGGAVLEGSVDNPNAGGAAEPCNPTDAMTGCSGERQGPDPINPIQPADNQTQSPVSQGTYKAHYVLLMLGVTTWF